MRGRPPRRSGRLLALLLPALLLALACGGAEIALELQPLPALDLSGAEAGARDQLVAQRDAVERLIVTGGTAPAELAQAFGDLGLLYVTYEFLEAAEGCFANARRLAPEDFRWHYLLGYLKMIQGFLPEANDLYERTLELEPDFLPAVLRLGRGELGQGRQAAARAWFERALELDGRAAAAHEGLGKVASAEGDDAAAIEHFRRALELAPEASGIHYALAQAYRNLGQLDEARSQLARSGDVAARIVDPLINPLASLATSAQFYIVQGAEAMDDGDYAASAAAFQAALEQDPDSVAAARGAAVGLERLGDVQGAREVLESVLDRAEGEDRALLLSNLGGLAALAGDENTALQRYLESLAEIPDQPGLLLRAANALARRGRFEEAITLYDRLIEVTPEWTAAVLEKRATALVNLGRQDEALGRFSACRRACPGRSPAAHALRCGPGVPRSPRRGGPAAHGRRPAERRRGGPAGLAGGVGHATGPRGRPGRRGGATAAGARGTRRSASTCATRWPPCWPSRTASRRRSPSSS